MIASLTQLAAMAEQAAKALASPDLLAPLAEADGSPWHRPKRQQRQRGKRRGVIPRPSPGFPKPSPGIPGPPRGPSQAALEVRAQEAADFLAGRLLRG